MTRARLALSPSLARVSLTRAVRAARTSLTRAGRAGFTLVELMAAMVAGAFVVASVYFVGAASQRHFQTQQRIASVQTNVRLAMDQVSRDVARAGFLAGPSSRRDQRCVTPATEIQAVEFQNDVDSSAIPLATTNGVSADRLFLVGSYASADQYFVRSISADGATVFLQEAWQGFRRSFIPPGGSPPAVGGPGTAWGSTFVNGRMVRLRTVAGNVFYGTITDSVAGSASVTISPALPVGTSCLGGLSEQATLAVLSRIRYSVDNGTGFASTALAPNNPAVTGPGTWLLRQEVDFQTGMPLPIQGPVGLGSAVRVVLENVIDFNVLSFTLDRELNQALPANLQRFNGAAAGPLLSNSNGNPAAVPEQVRAVQLSISARTGDLDPRYQFANTPPLTHFTFDTTRAGSAHVRTLRSEVFLTNMTTR